MDYEKVKFYSTQELCGKSIYCYDLTDALKSLNLDFEKSTVVSQNSTNYVSPIIKSDKITFPVWSHPLLSYNKDNIYIAESFSSFNPTYIYYAIKNISLEELKIYLNKYLKMKAFK